MRRLTAEELSTRRLSFPRDATETAACILADVRKRGDDAVREYSLAFDGVAPEAFRVERRILEEAGGRLDRRLEADLELAASHIRRFAGAQLEAYKNFEVEIKPGVFSGQVVVPIERAGIYVPGGRHPLISSLLMGAVTAKKAGVAEIAVFTPPGQMGRPSDAILAAARLCGVEEVQQIGGAQAVAAMAYGTESVKKVDKIFGPGNVYVAAAKRLVAGDVGVDFVAGPTELMIVADRSASPLFIAADLVAQAEHDPLASAILVSDSEDLAKDVDLQVEECLRRVRTAEVARRALETRGGIIVLPSLEEALELANEFAPEHLGLYGGMAERLAPKAINFGTLFLGEHAAEALADYSSGLNHILPTQRGARFTGGLSVRDFLKIQTTLRVTHEGLASIGPAACRLAEVEGLDGHRRSIRLRLADFIGKEAGLND